MNTLTKKLEIKNITGGYNGKKVIENISFSVNTGEIISIIGPSGTGKTTLFNIIAGLLKPLNEGKIYLNEKDITGKSGYVGYMLQKDLLLPFKTVLENITLPLIIKGIKKDEANQMALNKLKAFSLLEKANAYPKELSGGMKQRAALLRTYFFSNEAVLLDEPFSALDSITRESVHKWYLNVIKELNLTTVLITHDIDEAILLSDRVLILKGAPATISYEKKINLPRPRSNMTSDFIKIKKELLDSLLNLPI